MSSNLPLIPSFIRRGKSRTNAISILVTILLLSTWSVGAQDFADFQFKRIGKIILQADTPVDEELLLGLIELTPNVDILTRSKIRRSIELLYATGNFTNVLVDANLSGDRVDLTFILRSVYRIESIDLEGDTGIRKGKVRRRMRLRKLEPYTPEGVLSGRDDILSVLRENGYYNARVTPDVVLFRTRKRSKISYLVVAGLPARVASVDVEGKPGFPESRIISLMKSKPGSRFKEQHYTRDLEKIEEFYDRQGHLEHSIRDEKKILPPPAVSIGLNIDSGRELVLETVGYSFDQNLLREKVPIWVEHSYNDDTLDEGKRSLIDYLQQKGYYEAAITWTKDTSGEKILIRYVVEPGIKYAVSEIDIAGNQNIPDEDLREVMQTKTKGLFGGAPLVSKVFEADQNTILSAYKLKGFLFARFTKREVLRFPNGKIKLSVELEEGPRSIVTDIRIRGNQVFTTEELLARFRQKKDQPVSEAKVKADSDFLISLYSDRGYPRMQVENRLRLSQDKMRASLEYRITEGEQVFVDRIVFSGNYRTKRGVMEESLFFEEDEPLSLRKISESQSRLYGLNIFDRVEVEIPRPDSLQKFQNVLIRLTESKPYTITYGAGYQSFDRFRGIFGISNRNWFGTARTIALNTRAGFREGRVLISYLDPHLFFHRLTSDVSVFGEYGKRESFSFRRYGSSLHLERKLSAESTYQEVGTEPEPSKSIFLRYVFENIDTDGEPEVVEPEDRPFLAIRISSVTFGAVRDNRDNAIDPVYGNFLSSNLQFASNVLGSETDFVKSFSQAQYYLQWNRTVIASSLRLGLAWGFRTTNELPLSQRFFAGGGRTIRGFEQDTAGPLENGVPKGGNMLTILNLEYRFPVYKSLGAVVFFDYGTVFPEVSDFTLEGMREAAGIGIRYKTPIGPLTLDWGYKLDRQSGESPSEFFISVGHAF
ncbi:outer membrane protein assembly factor BamA [bacterium]|nr:outer membrane protein assembly factor BamA [bacterium]